MSSMETINRAREIYEAGIRSKVEKGNEGKYIVIDINSSDFAVGDDYLALSQTLQDRHPDSALATLRIGHRAVGRIGGRVRPVSS